LPIAVVGVAQTIDYDIRFDSQTFGTHGDRVARFVLDCAHNEANFFANGIGWSS
jgi:6-phosphofructokinase